ncbi:NADP-dependent oxidoreductase [Streptomyces sp. ODS28]|uniref:NADP-dependent oxidoreductase n=1 Tax=Streptomyces sp. ODS28 TaxID=3136688 RepID=UPI0031E6AD05
MPNAIAFTEYGPAEVLHPLEIAQPAPGPGQVRIAVRTAGVNPLDCKLRSGVLQQVYPVQFPSVPGLEAAGVVEALGEGVTELLEGDEVLGPTLTGAYAESALASAEALVIRPGSLSWEEAAGIPTAAETAYRLLDLLGLQPGQTLLVHGAAGGVGTLTVQFARARGLRVVGTASAANHDYLRTLGAVPVEYGEGLGERVRAAAQDGVDGALDLVGKGHVLPLSIELTGSPDRVITIADEHGPEYGVRFSNGTEGDFTRAALTAALSLQTAGTLQLPVHRTYPLDKAADAHRESETGHVTGKIVLTVRDDAGAASTS